MWKLVKKKKNSWKTPTICLWTPWIHQGVCQHAESVFWRNTVCPMVDGKVNHWIQSWTLRAARPVHPGRTLTRAGTSWNVPMVGQVQFPAGLLSGRWAKKLVFSPGIRDVTYMWVRPRYAKIYGKWYSRSSSSQISCVHVTFYATTIMQKSRITSL